MNFVNVSESLISLGIVFHKLALAAWKDLKPYVLVDILGTTRREFWEDRKFLLGLYIAMSSDRYTGAILLRHLYTKTKSTM